MNEEEYRIWKAEISHARRLVRFLQMLVCLLVPWLAYDLIYSWRF
jgi:hypothetical protein